MKSETTLLFGKDGEQIFVRHWFKDGDVKGVVHILHGMAEHSLRYKRFAQALVEKGFAVMAHDHRGHGETARLAGHTGLFSEENGYN